jgi:phosphoglycerate dehydrogenase-like enzyme
MVAVAVLDDYQGRAFEFADWTSLGHDVEVTFFREPIEPSELAAVLGRFDVLVLMRERTAFPRSVLEQLGNLKLLVTTGMGNASVDIGYLHNRGIVVSGTGGAGGAPPPGLPGPVEVAWALILATTKRVTVEDRAIRAGSWQLGLPSVLAGGTLGLAGLGRLGAAMVAPARVFGMEIIAWSENLTDARADEIGVRRVSKSELLSLSDILSIHLILSERSRGTFGAGDLDQMKPHAILINTARGPIVDESALVGALRSGTIGGAGLDVFDREPLPPDHALSSLDNVVLLPHLGYVSEPNFRAMYGQVVEDIAAFRRGEPLRVLGKA